MSNNSNNQNPQKDSMQVATLIHETDKMSSLEIAELTGKPHSDLLKAIRTMEPAWEKISGGKFSLAEYTDAQGKSRPCYELTKTECLYIATKFNDEARAKLVLRWEELELEKRPKITVPRKRNPSITTKVKASLLWVNGVSETLRLNESSKLLLLKKVGDPLGLPTPDYVPSKGILKSAGTLLKECGSSVSAQVFNKKMMESGMMENKSRPSSSGKIKHFKSIIGEGLNYGENQVNPNNPKETQPLYYEDKFLYLIKALNI